MNRGYAIARPQQNDLVSICAIEWVRHHDETATRFAGLCGEPGGSLIVMPDPFNGANRHQIVLLAACYGVPAIYFTPTEYPELGGLIAYGSDFAELVGRRQSMSTIYQRRQACRPPGASTNQV